MSAKEIVVISGKGGSGKTSLSASFAYLEENAIIADCDVDAANMHILLDADFEKQEDFMSGEVAVINEKLCTNCGDCYEVCRFNAITKMDNFHKVDPIACEGCWYCSRVCEHGAIEMITQKAGDIFISNIKNNGKMAHAKLGFAAGNSGKLVSAVKIKAKELAQNLKKEFIIVDGSPGVGCPVIASLSGAMVAVLVTESTISGLHDLKRVYQLVKNFHIRSCCIINKADLNEEKTNEIEEFCKNENIEVIAKLPYDVTFTKAMSEAKPIIEYNEKSEVSQLIKDSWEKIKELARK